MGGIDPLNTPLITLLPQLLLTELYKHLLNYLLLASQEKTQSIPLLSSNVFALTFRFIMLTPQSLLFPNPYSNQLLLYNPRKKHHLLKYLAIIQKYTGGGGYRDVTSKCHNE